MTLDPRYGYHGPRERIEPEQSVQAREGFLRVVGQSALTRDTIGHFSDDTGFAHPFSSNASAAMSAAHSDH